MSNVLQCRDAYFRMDNGPVQHARVWDYARWVKAKINEGIDARCPRTNEPKPVVVSVAEETEYRFEKGWR